MDIGSSIESKPPAYKALDYSTRPSIEPLGCRNREPVNSYEETYSA